MPISYTQIFLTPPSIIYILLLIFAFAQKFVCNAEHLDAILETIVSGPEANVGFHKTAVSPTYLIYLCMCSKQELTINDNILWKPLQWLTCPEGVFHQSVNAYVYRHNTLSLFIGDYRWNFSGIFTCFEYSVLCICP